ncbi:TetR family transcriptional regulator, partial [Cellulomonas bogoriensis 69B4 = DSM 16987]
RPQAFLLVFHPGPGGHRPGPEVSARAVAPVLAATAELAGERDALAAARTFTAWARGFIGMELADAFGLGGDVDAAFEYGVRHLVASMGRVAQ